MTLESCLVLLRVYAEPHDARQTRSASKRDSPPKSESAIHKRGIAIAHRWRSHEDTDPVDFADVARTRHRRDNRGPRRRESPGGAGSREGWGHDRARARRDLQWSLHPAGKRRDSDYDAADGDAYGTAERAGVTGRRRRVCETADAR